MVLVSRGKERRAMMRSEHTMKLVLNDVVRILKRLRLRWNWIRGVKELIYSILHDWSPLMVSCLDSGLWK
jgi:hypothetical protein